MPRFSLSLPNPSWEDKVRFPREEFPKRGHMYAPQAPHIIQISSLPICLKEFRSTPLCVRRWGSPVAPRKVKHSMCFFLMDQFLASVGSETLNFPEIEGITAHYVPFEHTLASFISFSLLSVLFACLVLYHNKLLGIVGRAPCLQLSSVSLVGKHTSWCVRLWD